MNPQGSSNALTKLRAALERAAPPASPPSARNDKWERSATRANARLERDVPLLVAAAIVPRRTAEDRRHEIEAFVVERRAARAALDVMHEAIGVERRERCRAVMTPETFALWERRRAVYPREGSYSADHWLQAARAAGLEPDPRGGHEAALARVRARVAAMPVQLALGGSR